MDASYGTTSGQQVFSSFSARLLGRMSYNGENLFMRPLFCERVFSFGAMTRWVTRVLMVVGLFSVTQTFAALPSTMRQIVLTEGVYLSGNTVFVATYDRFADLSQAEAEKYAAQGRRWAVDVSKRFDCLRSSVGADCVFIPKGELILTPAMTQTDWDLLVSHAAVAAALESDVRNAPSLTRDGNLMRQFSEILTTLKREKGFVARYLLILNRLTYETLNRETTLSLHSGIQAWNTGKGVCDAYANLVLYAAALSHLPAVVQTGDAYDAPSGKITAHAWVRIGSYLMDPTFDDVPVLRGDGSLEDTFKTPADLTYFALSGDVALADRNPDGQPKKDLLPAATRARYLALATTVVRGPATRLLAPYVKRRALGMESFQDIPTVDQIVALSVNKEIVNLTREGKFQCGTSQCSAVGQSYLPLTENNRAYIFQKYSIDRLRSLSVVRLRDSTLAAFPTDGQGVE